MTLTTILKRRRNICSLIYTLFKGVTAEKKCQSSLLQILQCHQPYLLLHQSSDERPSLVDGRELSCSGPLLMCAGPSRGTCGLCDCTGPPRARGPQISITLIWIYRPKLHPLADNSPPHISIPIKTPYGAAAAMHPALQACGPALPVLLSSGLKKLWTAPKSKLPVRI